MAAQCLQCIPCYTAYSKSLQVLCSSTAVYQLLFVELSTLSCAECGPKRSWLLGVKAIEQPDLRHAKCCQSPSCVSDCLRWPVVGTCHSGARRAECSHIAKVRLHLVSGPLCQIALTENMLLFAGRELNLYLDCG